MTTATAEKPTCTYKEHNGYTHTTCGEVEFADVTESYDYCPNCGKKIERGERK